MKKVLAVLAMLMISTIGAHASDWQFRSEERRVGKECRL